MDYILVDEVKLYKTIGRSRHEYISIKVLAPNKAFFYLAIERLRGEIIDKVDPKAQPPPPGDSSGGSLSDQPPPFPTDVITTASPPRKSSFKEKLPALPSASLSVTSLDKFVPKHNADDIVTLLSSGKHNNEDEVFRTLSFAPPIPLWKVAVLAKTLHNMSRHYLLFSDNCYYYAGTIIKVLQEEYNPTVDVDTTGSPELDEQRGLLSVKKEAKKNRAAGMWRNIEVYAGETVDIKPLKTEFEQALPKFMSTVCFLFWSTTMTLICFGLQVQERADKREEDANARKAAEAETTRVQKEADAEIARLKKEAEEKQKASDAEIARLRTLLEVKRPK